MKYLREIVPLLEQEFPIHQNKSIPTLKHLAANSPSKTMKFYISSSQPDANMYSGDSYYHTHHSMGARGSQIQGAITHHPSSDTYHYQAWHSRDGKNVEATHPKIANMEKFGVTRGHWDSDNARVEKPPHMSESIHFGTSINGLKGVAKSSSSGLARFVIASDNKLNAGDANHYYHQELMHDPNGSYQAAGIVKHNKHNDSYEVYHDGDSDHPLLDKMKTTYRMKHNPNGHSWTED